MTTRSANTLLYVTPGGTPTGYKTTRPYDTKPDEHKNLVGMLKRYCRHECKYNAKCKILGNGKCQYT